MISTSSGSWHPALGSTFQVQFEGQIDTSVAADVFDLDLFDTQISTISALHEQGKRVVCYISAGSWEDWRSDAGLYPETLLGRNYQGWPGEKWLDVRQMDVLAPILSARLDLCVSKGFDGVEADNVELLGNDTGFPLTYQDQLAFALWLADAAHARNLAIGLKNAPDMVADVLGSFDFAVVEECFLYGWCAYFTPFISSGKPVFALEYTDTEVDFSTACEQNRPLGLTLLLKNRSLDAFRQLCP